MPTTSLPSLHPYMIMGLLASLLLFSPALDPYPYGDIHFTPGLVDTIGSQASASPTELAWCLSLEGNRAAGFKYCTLLDSAKYRVHSTCDAGPEAWLHTHPPGAPLELSPTDIENFQNFDVLCIYSGGPAPACWKKSGRKIHRLEVKVP